MYPDEADISQEKLCDGPVGTALIGLCIGRSLTWKTPGGERRPLRALSAACLVGTDAMPSVRRRILVARKLPYARHSTDPTYRFVPPVSEITSADLSIVLHGKHFA